MVSGPRQIGNYPSARAFARSPRLRLIDSFPRPAHSAVLAIFGRVRADRDRENRDGAARTPRVRRSPDALEESWPGATACVTRKRYRADTARVDVHDNHDKMARRGGRGVSVEREEEVEERKGGHLAGVRDDALSVACNCCSPKLDPVRSLASSTSTGVDRKGSSRGSFSSASG